MDKIIKTNGQPISKSELAVIKVDGDVFDTTHNFPCPICRTNHAILNLNEGTFHPCKDCEKNNWFTVKIDSKIVRWIVGVKEYWYRSVK